LHSLWTAGSIHGSKEIRIDMMKLILILFCLLAFGCSTNHLPPNVYVGRPYITVMVRSNVVMRLLVDHNPVIRNP
jgi:hypothetical protein